MKIAVQVVDQESGHRTRVGQIERSEFANALLTLPDKEKYLVLIIMEMTDEGWDFSVAPFYSVDQFIQYFAEDRDDG